MNVLSDAKLFVATLQNDKYLHEDAILLGLTKKYVFYGINKNINKYVNNIFAKYSLILIFPLGFILLVIKDFFKSCNKIIFVKKERLKEEEYFIASTNFSKSINNRINKHIGNVCWLLNENINPKDYIIPNGKFISCNQIVGIDDAFSSLIGSFVVYLLICRKYGFYFMLGSLNAYKWLLFWKACKNIPKVSSLYFVDHKDRWAFLEDNINCDNKTLIQHGTEISNCSDDLAKSRGMHHISEGGWTQDIPYKYKSLKKVIAFSDKEISALKLSIIGCTPEFVVGGYDFETYLLDSNKLSVLIIAHSGIYFEKESQIIRALQDLHIDIYVKNHPTQSNESYHELRKHFNFTIISEQRFPYVDLVITYDSTLAHEYMSIGINVLYHTQNSLDKIIKSILDRI